MGELELTINIHPVNNDDKVVCVTFQAASIQTIKKIWSKSLIRHCEPLSGHVGVHTISFQIAASEGGLAGIHIFWSNSKFNFLLQSLVRTQSGIEQHALCCPFKSGIWAQEQFNGLLGGVFFGRKQVFESFNMQQDSSKKQPPSTPTLQL